MSFSTMYLTQLIALVLDAYINGLSAVILAFVISKYSVHFLNKVTLSFSRIADNAAECRLSEVSIRYNAIS